jgi:hypothetical protein
MNVAACHAHGTRWNEFGDLRNRVVSDIAMDVVTTDGHSTLAKRTSSIRGMWAKLGVSCKVPEQYGAAPVMHGRNHHILYRLSYRSNRSIPIFDHHLLGKFNALFWMSVMDLRHGSG